ncbi:MAG: rRNA maturation RNase YbeY [Granulosicoccaceae bacterium]|jgi:probable rRNA maturation factor
MKLVLDLQYEHGQADIPVREQFEQWLRAALAGRIDTAELSVRIVGVEEMTALNRDYRGKDKPTNVLTFPFELPAGLGEVDDAEMPHDLLGDIVICAEVVENEAREQGKAAEAHWAHMVVHGVLHLLGYDHIDPDEASQMEGIEIEILAQLGVANPYVLATDTDSVRQQGA